MPLSFQTNTIPVRALFSGEHVFRMPAFQRPYSWGEETAAQLNDIHTAHSRSDSRWNGRGELRDYFLGPLIIAQTNGGAILDVVDGQQRLATLCIIMWVLRDLADDRRFKNSLQAHLTSPRPMGTFGARVLLREIEQALRDSALTSAESPLYLTSDERADIRDILGNPIPSRKKFLRTLLLRLNAELRGKGSPVHFPNPITIEHILPQTPNATWLQLFPHTPEPHRLSELMGNYALLTRSLNSSQKNFEYQRKLEKMFSLNKNFQGFHITTNLRSFPAWTQRELLSRHEQLLRWRAEFSSLEPATPSPD